MSPRLLMFGYHFHEISYCFLLFSKIPSCRVLVFTPEKTLVPYCDMKNPFVLPNNTDHIQSFCQLIKPDDVVYPNNFNTGIHTRHNLVKTTGFEVDLLDLIFKPIDVIKSLSKFENSLFREQFPRYSSYHVPKFLEWYTENFEILPDSIKKLARFNQSTILQLCNLYPKIPLSLPSILDLGPPYLAIECFPEPPFFANWFRGDSLSLIWSPLYCKTTNYFHPKQLSLSLGAHEVLSLIPFLYSQNFRFSRRLCIQIALHALVSLNQSNVYQTIVQMCVCFLRRHKKIKLKKFDKESLLIIFKHLQEDKISKPRQLQLLLHRSTK